MCVINHFYCRSIFSLIEVEDSNWFLLVCKCGAFTALPILYKCQRWIFPGIPSEMCLLVIWHMYIEEEEEFKKEISKRTLQWWCWNL